MKLRLFLAALLGLGLALTAGCHRPPDKPSRFINLMGQSSDSLRIAGINFRRALYPLKSGTGLTKSQVRGPYSSMESALKKVKADWDDMWPPKKSESGEILLDTYRKYLDEEEKILQTASQIVAIVEDNAIDTHKYDSQGNELPKLSPEEQWAKVEPLINKMNSDESSAIHDVVEKQKDFAKEHNFNLVNPDQLKSEKKDD